MILPMNGARVPVYRAPAPVRTPARSPIPVRGTPITPPVLPMTGMPVRGTAIVSPGEAGSVNLAPQGGSGIIPPQVSGPPPSGTPPSISLVTNTAGVGTPVVPDAVTPPPAGVMIGGSSIPLGWIALAGVAVLVFFLARD